MIMSTEEEKIRAQRKIWQDFVDGVLPRKYWPKHMLLPVELENLYSEIEMLREENSRIRKLKKYK